jgi:hypothetical protein
MAQLERALSTLKPIGQKLADYDYSIYSTWSEVKYEIDERPDNLKPPSISTTF